MTIKEIYLNIYDLHKSNNYFCHIGCGFYHTTLLIGNKEFGEKNELKPRARIVATSKIGTDPTIMLTGPLPATEKVLKLSGMSIKDIDLFEVNEAFASVPLSFMEHFNVEHEKLNVNGGAIAMGHPLGAKIGRAHV